MSLIEKLSDENTWLEFREYKSKHSHMTNHEFDILDTFIKDKKYTKVTDNIYNTDHGFSIPLKRIINKSGTQKKRIIYTFPEEETLVLKLLTWLLYKYDSKISDCCYSFRRNITAKDAINKILQISDLEKKYSLKLDIHNYFNSMPTDLLTSKICEIINDDKPLQNLLCDLISVNKSISNGLVLQEARGAMAGVPISAFLANIFLLDLDKKFEDMKVPYFRYSDDIIVFSNTESELQEYKQLIEQEVKCHGLELNPDKTNITEPGQNWEYLGFEYCDGKINLSKVTINKIKGKIKRKCNSLYRWRIKKNVDFDHAAKVVINIFNRKFYDIDNLYEFTWSRWFFPVITTDTGLHTIDDYFINELRYIYSGRHYKGNYAVSYDHLKDLGYRSLVNEYYKFKSNGNISSKNEETER